MTDSLSISSNQYCSSHPDSESKSNRSNVKSNTSRPTTRPSSSNRAQNRCSIKTIFIPGISYKFGRIIVPSRLQSVAAKIIARAQMIKFLRYEKIFIIIIVYNMFSIFKT